MGYLAGYIIGAIVGYVIIGIIFGKVSKQIAQKKGYTEKIYFWLGFFFYVIGIIVAAVVVDKNIIKQTMQTMQKTDSELGLMNEEKEAINSKKVLNQFTTCNELDITYGLIIRESVIKEANKGIIAQIVFQKVNKAIASAKISLSFFNSFNELIYNDGKEFKEFLIQDLKTRDNIFTEEVAVPKDTRKIEITISKILLTNGDIIENKDKILIEPKFIPIIDPEEKKAIKNLIQKAEGYPINAENHWECCCGAVNSKSNEYCINCMNQKERVLSLITKDNVQNKIKEIREKEEKKKLAQQKEKIRIERAIEEKKKIEEIRTRKNKKKLKIAALVSVCLIVSTIITVILTNPNTYTKDFKVKRVEGGLEIIDCVSKDTDIVIPEKIHDIPIVSIGDHAFSMNRNLINISIPNNSVTNISAWAFSNCSNLTSIIIPNSVTSIGRNVLTGCDSLITLTAPFKSPYSESDNSFLKYYFGGTDSKDEIPSSLKTVIIAEGITRLHYNIIDCKTVTSIVIPNTVTFIESMAFYGCDGLESINVSEDNESYSTVDGVLFNKARTSIVHYPISNNATEYSIPSTVTSIEDQSFRSCKNLRSLYINSILPPNLGYNAFLDIPTYLKIYVPSGCVDTYRSASCWSGYFNHIYSQSPIEVDGLLIDNGILIGYLGTDTNINIPDSVKSIGSYAFCRSSLTSINIPDSVTRIGQYAFYYCLDLKSIKIPGSVTSIGSYAFANCRNLSGISFGANSKLTSIGEYAFDDCNSLKSIKIPGSVTSIGYYTFIYCSSLTIYAEAESKPTGWDSNWNPSRKRVFWGS